MRRLLLTTLALTVTLATGGALADNHGKGYGKDKRGGDRIERMREHLGLSDEQVTQMREIRANGGGREEMRAVLTDDQRAQIDAHREARRAAGAPGRHGKGEHRGGDNQSDDD